MLQSIDFPKCSLYIGLILDAAIVTVKGVEILRALE